MTTLSAVKFIDNEDDYFKSFRQLAEKKVVIIGDSQVLSIYELWLKSILIASGVKSVSSLLFPAGEKNKSIATWQRLLKRLVVSQADRQTVIIGLGGGVSTDLAGFVAATFMRGLPLWLIPTSLLAMVDASIGGKTAVNLPAGKNLIGAFYPAEKILISPSFLNTLPEKELINGAAEIVKIAFIYDKEFFSVVEKSSNISVINEISIIRRAICLKEQIVAQDHLDQGLRQVLNFGHTVGHALEKCKKRERLRHGEAVAVGMVIAAKLAVKYGFLALEDCQRLVAVLQKLGLPTSTKVTINRVKRFLLSDKKNQGGGIRMVLPKAVGEALVESGKYTREVPLSDLKEVWPC